LGKLKSRAAKAGWRDVVQPMTLDDNGAKGLFWPGSSRAPHIGVQGQGRLASILPPPCRPMQR
jgi:hypothetical protein